MIAYILLISITMACATSPPKIDLPDPEPSFCPHDESLAGLDMKKMLGKWHVAEASTTIPPEGRERVKPISGQTMTFTEDSGVYHLTHTLGKTNPFIHEYKIVQEDREIKRHIPEQINEIKLAVVATDYDNVALVITCEQNFNFHRVARVLLRNDSEDNQKYIDQMNEKLPGYGFVVENMEKVDLATVNDLSEEQETGRIWLTRTR